MKTDKPDTVVLVHGLWHSAYCLLPLARRLERQGFIARLYSYSSVGVGLRDNAERLARFLVELDADSVHLVGHSLGGILIRALFHFHPNQQSGRIVLLGTPHGGSQVAKFLSQFAFWRWAMGKSVADLLRGLANGWTPPMGEMGTISGSRSLGMGRMLYCRLAQPNDGLLTVEESTLAGVRDHVVLPVSHTGMLFSRTVAHQVNAFLRSGHFDP
ncbi:MAG: esterase/lipase family protein [Sulfuricaulis sp.]